MTIVYVLELFYPNIGGVEKLFYTLAKSNIAAGNKVRVITTRFSRELPEKEIHEGIEIIRLKLSNRFMFTFFGYFAIRKHISEADIVHTTSFNAAMPAFYAARNRKKKCIITYHEVWVDLWKTLPGLNFLQRFFYRIYEKRLLRLRFGSWVTPSLYTAGMLKINDIPENKIDVIYNGIDYNGSSEKEHPVSKNYVYFGRAGISKGLEMLIEAAAKANPEYDHTLYLILPEIKDAYSRKIKNLASETGSGKYIRIIESIPQEIHFSEYLRTFDFAVIPSVSEGFCFAAAEAAAIGLPVVSSGRGALSEVVSGKHLHMKEYSAFELEKCLAKAMSGEWEYKPLVSFETETTIKAYSDLYHRILK